MTVEITMPARTRSAGKGPARRSRRQGWIPAILYGRQVGAVPVEVPARELGRCLAAGLRTGTLVRLQLEMGDRSGEWTAVLKEIQQDPVSRRVLHLDLQQVSWGDVLEVEIPVVLRGTEEVMRRGGVLQHQLRTVRVECPVTAIPTDIEADVSRLRVGEHLTVADLVLPPGVRAAEEPDEVVVTVLAPRHEEEEEKPAEEGAEKGAEEGAPAGGAA